MPHTPEVIYCDHMHCFSMNVSPDKEDTFVVWLLGLRIKKEVTRREYWVQPYFNKSGGLSSSVVPKYSTRTVRDLDNS